MTDGQSRNLQPKERHAAAAEASDILLHLIPLTSAIGIDPVAAAQNKLKLNELRHLIDRGCGSTQGYDEL
jgi:phage terminase small subunit